MDEIHALAAEAAVLAPAGQGVVARKPGGPSGHSARPRNHPRQEAARDEPFTVRVSRRWTGMKVALLSRLGIYMQWDSAPLGLFVDFYA